MKKARCRSRHAVAAGILSVLFLIAAAGVTTDAKTLHHRKQAPGQSTTTARPSSGSSFYGDIAIGDVGSPNVVTPSIGSLVPETGGAARMDWLVTVGGDVACSGVLIAPKFVLTSVSCVQKQSKEAEGVQFWVTRDNQNTSLTVPVARVKLQATMLKTFSSSKGGAPEAEFAILELVDAAPVRPVALESSAHSWKADQESGVVRVFGASQTRDGGERASEINVISEGQACSAQNDLICVVMNETCEALHGSDNARGTTVFLVARSRDDQVAQLVGVNPSNSISGCRDLDNERMSTNRFVPVTALENFIDRNSVDHRWTSSSPLSPSPGAMDVPTKDLSSSSSDSNGSDDSRSGGEPEPQQPAPSDWSMQLGYLRVKGEETSNTLTGPPVVLIAPHFALTRALWLDESKIVENSLSSRILLVAFENEVIPVKNIIFQRDLQSHGEAHGGAEDGDDLVVLELKFEAMVAPSPILATSLQLDVVSPTIEVVVLDELEGPDSVTLMSGATFKDVALSACSWTDENKVHVTQEVVCASVPSLGLLAPPSSLNQGVLRVDGYLVGFSTSTTSVSSSSTSDGYARYAFTRVSSERHFQFLARATRSTVAWEESVSGHDWNADDFPSFIVSFAASDKYAAKISCQGMLVAPKFVLTTASCALGNPISEIIFPSADGQALHVPYSPQMTIPHPKYNKSALGDERYDIAILQLEFATTVTPVTLSLGAVNHTNDDLLGFSFPQSSTDQRVSVKAVSYSRVAFNRSEKCTTRASSNSSLPGRLQTSICITPSRITSHTHEENTVDDAALNFNFGRPEHSTGSSGTLVPGDRHREDPEVGDPDPLPSVIGDAGTEEPNPLPRLPSLMGSVIGKQLNNSKYSVVGFAVTQEDTKGAEVYSIATVADYAVFINAYVVGSFWESGGLPVDGPIQTPKRYIVGLRVSKSGQNFCGGSLIAPNYVLTAAHCVTDGLANWVSVGAKSSSGSDTEAIPIIKDTIVIHQKYGNPSRFSFDAAIFELKTAAYADPVALDTSPDFSGGERATMYGYGVTVHIQGNSESTKDKSLSSEIRAVDLSLLSQAQCEKTLPDIDNSMLCAVGENGADACKGDSGGPLVVPDGGQSTSTNSSGDVLVGFVSSGYDCGLKNVPGIYMRVSSLVPFIKRNTVGAEWSAPIPTQLPSPAMISSPSPPLSPSAASEVRDLDDLTPRESDVSENSSSSTTKTPSTTTTIATGLSTQPNENVPITFEDLPKNLAPQVRHAVLRLLLGISDASEFISADLLERLASESNAIRFFSTGDLSKLLEIIKRHNEKPLYARRDRFSRQKAGATALAPESTENGGVFDSTVCTL